MFNGIIAMVQFHLACQHAKMIQQVTNLVDDNGNLAPPTGCFFN